MMISQSKESILKKIRQALSTSTPLPFPKSEGNSFVYQPQMQELELEFAQNFTKLQGKFVFCLNEAEMVAQLAALVQQYNWTGLYTEDVALQKQISEIGELSFPASTTLANCDVAITTCEALVARTGSIVLSAALAGGRTTSVYAPIHICIAYTNQLMYDVKDALEAIKAKYPTGIPSLISFASGPSRTADIEKTLVVGIHGPKEVYVFLIDAPVNEEALTSAAIADKAAPDQVVPDNQLSITNPEPDHSTAADSASPATDASANASKNTTNSNKGIPPTTQIDLFSNNNT